MTSWAKAQCLISGIAFDLQWNHNSHFCSLCLWHCMWDYRAIHALQYNIGCNLKGSIDTVNHKGSAEAVYEWQ